jgi:hypothetical protein
MWARFANLAIGIWLMVAPDLLAYSGSARMNHLIVGPIIASVAVVGMWEAVREVRRINLVLGVWLVVSSLVLSGNEPNARFVGAAAGLLVTAFSLFKGKIRNRFDGGWRMLFKRR